MSNIDRIVKDIKTAIRTANDRATSPYDVIGTVTRVEGTTAWVHFPGGIDETPVRMTIDSKAGDTVQVRVGGGRAWITGNDTAPPTDDQEAIIAQVSARLADKKAVTAGKTADKAREEIKAVASDLVVTNELVAQKASVVDLDAEKARINQLEATSLTADSAVIRNLEADTAKVHNLTAEQLSAATAYIAQLVAGSIQASTIIADNGRISTLEANSLTAQSAEIQALQADTAKIHSLTAEQLSSAVAYIASLVAQNITASNIVADHGTIGSLDTNYARINLANVNNAWIENGVVKDASIADAKIIGMSANKLTAGTIDASNITVTNLNADNITTGTINGQRIGTGSLSLDKLSEDVYTEAEVDAKLSSMQDEIDGAIETWTGSVVPTLNNNPASDWETTSDRDKHVGDVYYVVNSGNQADGYCYRFAKNGSTYSWVLIKDSDVTAALQRLLDAEGDIDNLQTFESNTSSWISNTDEELRSLKTRTTNVETGLGDKVSTSVFNELSQTVDENSSSITSLSETVNTKADGSTVSTLSNTVNTISQTATKNSSKLSNLTTILGTNADGTTKAGDIVHKASEISQDLNGFKTTVSNTYQTKSDMSNYSTTNQMNSAISQSASSITQSVSETYATKASVYTKTQTDNLLSDKADGSDLSDLEDRVTIAEGTIETQAGQIELKANASDTYTKTATEALLQVKANKATLTSEINASADTVKINANRLNITGVITAINDDSTTTIDGGKISTGSIEVGSLENNVRNAIDAASNTLIYDHTYDYNYDSNHKPISATFTAFLYRGGVDVKTEYTPASDYFLWFLKCEDKTTGAISERQIGTGYQCTVLLSECGYGAEVVGKCVMPDEAEALSTNGDNLTTANNNPLTVRSTGDEIRVRDLSVTSTIFPTDKFMVVGSEDEHLITVQALQDYLNLHLDKQVLFNTTAGWNSQITLVSDPNTLYIYTDHDRDSHGNAIAGIKAGDGNAYVVDLPFTDAVATEHIADNTRHVTQAERDSWNNKVRCYYAGTEQLIFTTA